MDGTSGTGPAPVEAVLFDFTGVLTGSPWAAIGGIGDKDGLSHDEVLAFMLGPYDQDTDHPMHQLERGEIELMAYVADVQARAEAAGLELDFDRLRTLMSDLPVYEQMVVRIRALRAAGLRTALITNNIREAGDQWRAKVPLDELFDVVIDSSAVGLRKPNPAIFRLALEQLGGVDPARAVFLDDHPGNVAGAEAVGIRALLVDDVDEAIADLDALLGTQTALGAEPSGS
ncbi:MAG: HAD family phosphatase [Acidimicrobiales bacterium]|nr:HAD family phosphatase [Acidimicrobiales bacterium]MCB9371780.1 HAD family phosphatase [Microthrixaceae bacterium]